MLSKRIQASIVDKQITLVKKMHFIEWVLELRDRKDVVPFNKFRKGLVSSKDGLSIECYWIRERY